MYEWHSKSLSPLGKAVSESAADSPAEQLKVNSAPPAHSEVIYDDVPCENNSPPDAGQCLLSIQVNNVITHRNIDSSLISQMFLQDSSEVKRRANWNFSSERKKL